jgi:hypothetical protein
LYERWLATDAWTLDAALALIVGLDPAAWTTHIDRNDLALDAATLRESMLDELGVDRTIDDIVVAELAVWMARHGCAWPAPAAALLDFIARTLPAARRPIPPAASGASEREAILGAALALATRFTERCLDGEGYYDARRMVSALRSQAVVWFGEQRPELDETAMIELLERYLPVR